MLQHPGIAAGGVLDFPLPNQRRTKGFKYLKLNEIAQKETVLPQLIPEYALQLSGALPQVGQTL